ncbi:universal stress protein [Limibaculum sp. M0105]|uniref:Universal stress protein n=1 Tax=Thermohalobaculum xanthum TaxID=2753746 RepID=A0A8J7SER4_9RHOB|nr:universal stress protein [Thermohalobaculum xanthum]MBK0399988.1 universal stress protein [Thermohalobaculum xanthum]
MAFRSAAVFVDGMPGSDNCLARAIALASRHGAHLDVVALLEEPPFNYVAGAELAIEVWSEQVQEMRRLADEIAAKAVEKVTAAGLSAASRGDTSVVGGISEIAALNARYCDLGIVGQPMPDSDAEKLHSEILDGILFSSGRPVLIMPGNGADEPDFRRIVIAWDAGRTAARAVHDAMPFLKAADAVSLTLIDPKAGGGRYGDEPGADIARQIARHGIEVSVDRLPAMGKPVAECILGHATDFGAGMIVMGGYGHSKLTEQIFGGVTRDMLHGAPVPIFMSH